MAPRYLHLLCILSGVLISSVSWAQQPPADQAAAQTATQAATTAEEQGPSAEVVITGSRIVDPEYAHSNPVVAISAEALQNSGMTNLGDFLKQLPALTGSLDSNDAAGSNTFIGGTGLDLLNLRNLGVDRTLVLVDGRRHVASLPGSAAVDVDTIPLALVDRIEVETGGASAVYGADGVSGVVNFIMKKDFQGVSFRSQFGESSLHDSEGVLASVAAGMNFGGGKGNLSGALEFSREDRLKATQRDFAAGGKRKFFVDNPADPNDDPSLVDNVIVTDLRFFGSSPAGAVDIDFDGVPDFNGNDQPFDNGEFIPPFYQIGGDAVTLDDYIGDLTPQEKRYTGNLFFTYEMSEKIRFFSEAKYSRTDAFSESQPTFDFSLAVFTDAYPFVPPNIAAAAAGGPVLVSRDNFDMGVRNEDIRRETARGVLGFDGHLTDDLRYEVSYVYGQTKVHNHVGNNRFNDRFAAALDAVIDPATGQPTCASNLDPSIEPFNLGFQGWNSYTPLPGTWAGSFQPGPNSGCVPINIFGDGSPSQAALDFIFTTSLTTSTLKQQVAQAYVSGDTNKWFHLPGGAVGYAAGVEWRKESSENNPAIEDRQGLTFGNVIEPTQGDYNVKEAYAELILPFLKDAPFAKQLSLDTAIRFSDYSTIGNATTWNAGLIWAPINDLMLRGGLAQATRAPNIGELFDPGGQTFEFIDDPCDINNVDEGTSFRQANCQALLTSLGVADPANYHDLNSTNISGTLRGNPDLSEETADTTTAGIVLRPRFIPGFTMAVDWYDIKLKQAVNTAAPQDASQICVDLPTLDNDFCDLITRETGSGRIVDFIERPLNVASFTTRGYDFVADYRLPTQGSWGTFDIHVVGNYLTDLTFVNLPGAAPDPDKGEEDAPDWQTSFDLLWNRGPLSLNYGLNYFDATQRFTLQQRASNPDISDPKYYNYKSKLTHDLQGRYRFANRVSIAAGINNITNEKPDIGRTFYPVSAVGRFYFVGVNFANFAE